MKILPAEWEPQSAVQLTWPQHPEIWGSHFEDAVACFQRLAKEISQRQKLLLVCASERETRPLLRLCTLENIIFAEISANDVWARDHAAFTVLQDGQPQLLDFVFNGWGMKFAANLDNQITRKLKAGGFFKDLPVAHLPLVLEGGSLESDGRGTLLTTSTCLLSPNRNEYLGKAALEEQLQRHFGARKVLWLNHGHLEGDDTDSHIDILARFAPGNRLVYMQCTDPTDPHFEELQAMEKELQQFTDANGQPFELFPLPLPFITDARQNRLGASYANFLIINKAVLVPVYGAKQDEQALQILKKVFPGREVVGINCLPLITQGGSLHCVSMQFPEAVFGSR